MSADHFDPNQPRDPHGCWTAGDSSGPARLPPDTTMAQRANILLNHARAGAWLKGLATPIVWPTPDEAKRFGKLIKAWTKAAQLNDKAFQDRFTSGILDNPTTATGLRQAITAAAQACTFDQINDASNAIADAIKDMGADRWARVQEQLADRAKNGGKAGTPQPALPAPNPSQVSKPPKPADS